MANIQVSVIIINFNTLELTRNCIESIFDHTNNVNFEIIIVDNNSTDGSKEYFENDNRIRYIYNESNLGFGRANNIGMNYAKGEYIFLLNSDTLLLNNAIELFYKSASKEKEFAFYGGWLLNFDKKLTLSFGPLPTMRNIIWDYLKKYYWHIFKKNSLEKIKRDSPDMYEVGYISGADIFINRKILEKIGGFDENIFMYFEETEWQRRGKDLGIRSYVIKSPQIIHLEGGSLNLNKKGKRKNILKLIWYLNSMVYYLGLKHNNFQCYIFKICYLIVQFPFLICTNDYEFGQKIKYIKEHFKLKNR